MSEISESEQMRLQKELRRIVGDQLTGFTVTNGVLVVTVWTQEAADALPASVGGYPVDVSIEGPMQPETCFHGGTDYSITDRRKRTFNPMPIGVQIQLGRSLCSSGGVLVDNGKHFVLTAGHCALIEKPNRYEGILYHGSRPVAGQMQGDSYGDDKANYDYAFGPIYGKEDTAISVSTEVLGMDAGVSHVVRPQVGEEIIKAGRTTGVTRSTVAATGWNYAVSGMGDSITYFSGGIRTETSMSEPGDSGSMGFVVRDGNIHPVGILSAGSTARTTFCSIRDVLNRINKKMLTGRKVVHQDDTESRCVDIPVADLVKAGENGISVVPGGD